MALFDSGDLGKLVVRIGADLEQLTKGLKEAEEKVDLFSNRVNISTKGIASAFAVVGSATVTALGAIVHSTTQYADEIFTASKRTGIATETLSKLKFVAEQTESSFEAVTTGVRFLSRNMFEAANGNDQLAKTFDRLGINLKNSSGQLLSVDDALLQVADKISKVKDQSEKTAIAIELFGRGGTALLPVLNLGSEGILKLSKRAEELGLVLTEKNAVAIDDFDDSVKELRASIGGLTLTIGQEIVPALKGMVEFIKTGVIPVIENLKATFDLINKDSINAQLSESLGSTDPVLENARKRLVEVQAIRDKLQEAASTSGGRGTSGQQEQVNALVVEEERLRNLIVERMNQQRQLLEEQKVSQETVTQSVERQTEASQQISIQEQEKINQVIQTQQEIALLKDEELVKEQDRINIASLAFKTAEEQKTEIIKEEIKKRTQQEAEKEKAVKERGATEKKVTTESLQDSILALQILGKENKAAAIAYKLILAGRTIATTAKNINEAFPNPFLMALAAATGALQLATINGVQFAKGSPDVPDIGGVTHPGEIVVPKTFAEAIREGRLSLSGPAVGGSQFQGLTISNIEINVTGSIDRNNTPDLIEQLGAEFEARIRGAK